jgi:hypothetical protein
LDVGGRDVQPTLEPALAIEQGLFKRPVRSSASSRWLQALVQNRKQLRGRSFALAAWPSCCGPRLAAANELGGGPVRHVRPTDLERLAGPSAPCSATPHAEFDLTPRISQRAEKHWGARLSRWTSPARGKWRRLRDQNWLQVPDRSQRLHFGFGLRLVDKLEPIGGAR